MHAIAGQMYRRNRYYDPQTGRFTQEDPIGLAGGLNAYGFGNGDPIDYTDPFGLCTFGKDCWKAFKSAVSKWWNDPMTGFMLMQGAEGFYQGSGDVEPEDSEGGDGIDEVEEMQLAPGTAVKSSSPDFVVTGSGTAIPIPNKAEGPTAPARGTGMVYTGGSGGKGMDSKVTGVRIMDANKNQGRRVNYMNAPGQTVNPKNGRTISKSDPAGHIPVP